MSKKDEEKLGVTVMPDTFNQPIESNNDFEMVESFKISNTKSFGHPFHTQIARKKLVEIIKTINNMSFKNTEDELKKKSEHLLLVEKRKAELFKAVEKEFKYNKFSKWHVTGSKTGLDMVIVNRRSTPKPVIHTERKSKEV